MNALPSRILCLSDSDEDVRHFTKGHRVDFFPVQQFSPLAYHAQTFRARFQELVAAVDLDRIGLIIAEYVEALPLVHLIRENGIQAPAILIPHSTPYPLDTFALFLLLAEIPVPGDCVLCGSEQAARGFRSSIGLPALSICTFGIHELHGDRMDRISAKRALGLPSDRTIVLSTGRFMPDKGLREWVQVLRLIRAERPDILPVVSATHLSIGYFNDLAPSLADSVFFYRLPRAELALLYQASDLFLSCATSVFETYGKSPLEAIAAGIPVVLPRWDGFQDYVSTEDGLLAPVDFFPEPLETPYQFARVNVHACADQCLTLLERPHAFAPNPKPWGLRSGVFERLQEVVDRLMGQVSDWPGANSLHYSRPTSPAVGRFIEEFGLPEAPLSLEALEEQGILVRKNIGSVGLRRMLHDLLFKT